MNPVSISSSGHICRRHPFYAMHSIMAHILFMAWGTTSLCTILLAWDKHHAPIQAWLTDIKPILCISGILILLNAAGCRWYRHRLGLPPLLSRRSRLFCLLSFSLGLLSFLLYAALTASYSPSASSFPELALPSAYTHEFSGSALLFCLVLALGALSLIASLPTSTNHTPRLMDILAVLGSLLAPFLCIFLLRTPEVETQAVPRQKTPVETETSPVDHKLDFPQ